MFAVNANLHEIRKQRRHGSWDFALHRARDAKLYTSLYVQRLKGVTLSQQEEVRIIDLELKGFQSKLILSSFLKSFLALHVLSVCMVFKQYENLLSFTLIEWGGEDWRWTDIGGVADSPGDCLCLLPEAWGNCWGKLRLLTVLVVCYEIWSFSFYEEKQYYQRLQQNVNNDRIFIKS